MGYNKNPRRLCSIEGCSAISIARGYCSLHYERWRKHGNPLRTRESAKERFLRRVDKDGPTPKHCRDLDPCWLWVGGRVPNGYGSFYTNGKTILTHKFSYTLFIGNVPEDLWVLHRCDNKICVNPSHLFLGTNLDNIEDCVAKGRQAKGIGIHTAKLTDECVREIRRRSKLGGPGNTGKEMAVEFGVCAEVIRRAIRRETWKHV